MLIDSLTRTANSVDSFSSLLPVSSCACCLSVVPEREKAHPHGMGRGGCYSDMILVHACCPLLFYIVTMVAIVRRDYDGGDDGHGDGGGDSRGAFCGMALGGSREAFGARVPGASRNGDSET